MDEYAERYRQIGLRIQFYRKLRKLTQEQLAEKADISASFVSQVEAQTNTICPISLKTLFTIAKVLDVEPYKFLIIED